MDSIYFRRNKYWAIRPIPVQDRECYRCGRKHAGLNTLGYERWYANRGTSFWLCHCCNDWVLYSDYKKREEKLKLLKSRFCYACGATEHSRNGNGGWLVNWGTPYFLCHSCKNILLRGLKRRSPNDRSTTKNRISFKGRIVNVGFNPRIGVCNWCRAVVPFDSNKTNMHHDDNRYDDLDPLMYTIEVCTECHTKYMWNRSRNLNNQILH